MNEQQNLSIKSWADDDKPREKMLSKGKNALSDSELIAILIGSGSRKESAVKLSQRILTSVNNDLNALGKTGIADLMKFKGVGEAKAITIAAAMELGRRRKELEPTKQLSVNSSNDAFEIINGKLFDLKHEEFWMLLLSRSNKVIDVAQISSGGVTGTVVDIKMILKLAIEKLCSGLILVHNHPSGNLKPSQADIQITKKIKEASNMIDVSVLDHLIISDNKYYSFLDSGLL